MARPPLNDRGSVRDELVALRLTSKEKETLSALLKSTNATREAKGKPSWTLSDLVRDWMRKALPKPIAQRVCGECGCLYRAAAKYQDIHEATKEHRRNAKLDRWQAVKGISWRQNEVEGYASSSRHHFWPGWFTWSVQSLTGEAPFEAETLTPAAVAMTKTRLTIIGLDRVAHDFAVNAWTWRVQQLSKSGVVDFVERS